MDRERPNMFESPESPKREAPFREPKEGDFEEIAPIESSPEDDFRNRERIDRIKEKLQILPEYREGHGAERREDNMSRAGYIPDYLRERRMGGSYPCESPRISISWQSRKEKHGKIAGNRSVPGYFQSLRIGCVFCDPLFFFC